MALKKLKVRNVMGSYQVAGSEKLTETTTIDEIIQHNGRVVVNCIEEDGRPLDILMGHDFSPAEKAFFLKKVKPGDSLEIDGTVESQYNYFGGRKQNRNNPTLMPILTNKDGSCAFKTVARPVPAWAEEFGTVEITNSATKFTRTQEDRDLARKVFQGRGRSNLADLAKNIDVAE